MFNIDESQRRVIRIAAGSAAACWLLAQIADSSLFERIWSQAAILSGGAGAIRVWILEGAKVKG
jgi:hypothetical protein